MTIKQSRKLNKIEEFKKTFRKNIEGNNFFRNEVHALTLFKKHAPKLIEAKKPVIMMEKIVGQHLSECTIDDNLIIKLAQALNYLHSFKKGKKSLIHGDLHKDNIFITKEGIKFIDFACSTYGDPMLDAAAIEIHITDNPILLKTFYKHLKAKRDIEIIDDYKIKHCLQHLKWNKSDDFYKLMEKSRKIIKKIKEKRNIKIEEEDFDYLGLIELENIDKIENFVTPLENGHYLSRNRSYYSNKTTTEASIEREYCNSLLPAQGKRAFVIIERMLNNSCRSYYVEFIKLLTDANNLINFQIAKKCLDSDTQNIIRLLQEKKALKTSINLPRTNIETFARQIESDHKMILLKTVKNIPKQKFIVSPLLGGILIGPFFKALHGINYAHVIFGMHDQNSINLIRNNRVFNLSKIIPKSEIVKIPKTVTFFDDNIGTGETLSFLKRTFNNLGHKVKIGAIEMSWDYYNQAVRGKNKIFDFNKIDFPTYRNTRHHSITDELIKALSKGGTAYRKTLKSKGFASPFLADEELLYFRGHSIANKHGLIIKKDYVNLKSNLILSVDIMKEKIRYMEYLPVDRAIEIIYDYPIINIIDIDRYYGKNNNLKIIKQILKLKKCRIGGGIRTRKDIQKLLNIGAEKVIIGTFANEKLLKNFPKEKIIVTIDSIDRMTNIKKDVPALIKRFEPFCDEFQYVCVETDGKAMGGDINNAIKYSKLTKNKFNCVGGIAFKKEMKLLAKYNIGCVVGRAIEDGYLK